MQVHETIAVTEVAFEMADGSLRRVGRDGTLPPRCDGVAADGWTPCPLAPTLRVSGLILDGLNMLRQDVRLQTPLTVCDDHAERVYSAVPDPDLSEPAARGQDHPGLGQPR